jgi:hypothetical protein
MSPVGLSWVVLVEHPLFAVARRAYVKCGFGIVMVGQVVRCIGASGTELDSHVPPPKAANFFVTGAVAGQAHIRGRPSGIWRLDSISWLGVGGICVRQTAIPD